MYFDVFLYLISYDELQLKIGYVEIFNLSVSFSRFYHFYVSNFKKAVYSIMNFYGYCCDYFNHCL